MPKEISCMGLGGVSIGVKVKVKVKVTLTVKVKAQVAIQGRKVIGTLR
jgi:hypothetical protein